MAQRDELQCVKELCHVHSWSRARGSVLLPIRLQSNGREKGVGEEGALIFCCFFVFGGGSEYRRN